MLATDVGFLGYWLVTVSHALPSRWLFHGYDDPIVQAWNWSFFPLDLAISLTGMLALSWARRGRLAARALAVASLTLTSASGLMAVSFWAIRRDFDVSWWAANLVLLLYPLFFLPKLVSAHAAGRSANEKPTSEQREEPGAQEHP